MNYIVQEIMNDTLLQLIQEYWEYGKGRVNVFILVDSETVHSSTDRKYLLKLTNKRPNTKTLIFANGHFSVFSFMVVIPCSPTGRYQRYGE
jgi:hypothetical protein